MGWLWLQDFSLEREGDREKTDSHETDVEKSGSLSVFLKIVSSQSALSASSLQTAELYGILKPCTVLHDDIP